VGFSPCGLLLAMVLVLEEMLEIVGTAVAQQLNRLAVLRTRGVLTTRIEVKMAYSAAQDYVEVY
jgi:hypothetical protein